MTKKEQIIEAYPDEEFMFADGFDDAIIGVVHDFNAPGRVAYSVNRCIDQLAKEMSEEEASEFFSYNVSGAYVGEKTPIWVWDI